MKAITFIVERLPQIIVVVAYVSFVLFLIHVN